MSQQKLISISTFKDTGLQLHKWNFNKIQLEDMPIISRVKGSNQTYVKKQLGAKPNGTKILEIHWDTKK